MSYRKRGGGLLGLLVVVMLGVMAFASSAQALVPKFNLNGSTAHFSITGTQEGTGTLLVPASNLSLKCTEFEVLEGLVLAGGLVSHFKLLYKGCTTVEHKATTELPCHVVDHVDKTKLHVTAEALLLPVEFADGKFGILAEKINVKILFKEKTGCPLPLSNPIKGEICFKITANNNTSEPLIQSSKTIQGECPEIKLELIAEKAVGKDKILFGANEAFIEASAILKDVGIGNIGVSLL